MAEQTYTPPPVAGYRALTQAEVDLMNEAKDFEAKAAELLDRIEAAVRASGAPLSQQQGRDLSLARTHFENATIRAVRAVAHPVSPWFPR